MATRKKSPLEQIQGTEEFQTSTAFMPGEEGALAHAAHESGPYRLRDTELPQTTRSIIGQAHQNRPAPGGIENRPDPGGTEDPDMFGDTGWVEFGTPIIRETGREKEAAREERESFPAIIGQRDMGQYTPAPGLGSTPAINLTINTGDADPISRASMLNLPGIEAQAEEEELSFSPRDWLNKFKNLTKKTIGRGPSTRPTGYGVHPRDTEERIKRDVEDARWSTSIPADLEKSSDLERELIQDPGLEEYGLSPDQPAEEPADTPKEKARVGAGREKKPEITKEILAQVIDESVAEPSGPPWFQRLYDNLGLDIGGRMARAIDGEVLKFYANQLEKGEKSLEADGRDYNRMMEILIQQSGAESLEQMRQTGYAARANRKGRRNSTIDWAKGNKSLSYLGDWLIRKSLDSQEIVAVLRAAKKTYNTSFGPAMFNVLEGQRIWDSANPGESGNDARAEGLNKMGMQRMNEDSADFLPSTQGNVNQHQVRRFVNSESKRLADQAVDLAYGQASGGVKKEKSPSYNELFIALSDLVGETLVIEASKNKSLERYLDTEKGKRNVYLMLNDMNLSPARLGLYGKEKKKKWKSK